MSSFWINLREIVVETFPGVRDLTQFQREFCTISFSDQLIGHFNMKTSSQYSFTLTLKGAQNKKCTVDLTISGMSDDLYTKIVAPIICESDNEQRRVFSELLNFYLALESAEAVIENFPDLCPLSFRLVGPGF